MGWPTAGSVGTRASPGRRLPFRQAWPESILCQVEGSLCQSGGHVQDSILQYVLIFHRIAPATLPRQVSLTRSACKQRSRIVAYINQGIRLTRRFLQNTSMDKGRLRSFVRATERMAKRRTGVARQPAGDRAAKRLKTPAVPEVFKGKSASPLMSFFFFGKSCYAAPSLSEFPQDLQAVFSSLHSFDDES